MEAIASQVSIAIEHGRLVNEQVRTSKTLSDFTDGLKRSIRLERKQTSIWSRNSDEFLAIGRDVYGMEIGVVNEFRDDSFDVLASTMQLHQLGSDRVRSLQQSLCAETLRQGKTVTLNALSEQRRRESDGLLQGWSRTSEPRSLLMASHSER